VNGTELRTREWNGNSFTNRRNLIGKSIGQLKEHLENRKELIREWKGNSFANRRELIGISKGTFHESKGTHWLTRKGTLW